MEEISSEIKARKQYIEKVTGVWFVSQKKIDNFLVLESMPSTYNKNICIIYGHNYLIDRLLSTKADLLPEKNIFIFSCKSTKKEYWVTGKNIYLAPQTKGKMRLINGELYGFSFDITETEINLYNSRKNNIFAKLKESFSIPNVLNNPA